MATLELPRAQVERAAEALVKHHTAFREKKAKADLLEEDGDEFVFLVVSLTQVPGTQRKPKFIPLPHAIRDDTADACMFVKDGEEDAVRDKLEAGQMRSVKEVISLSRLRQDFRDYSKRLELLKVYDLFLADDRILPMLSKALGKKFFVKKKLPIPVRVNRKHLARTIRTVLSGTSVQVGMGPCVSIRAATTSLSASAIADNVIAVAEKLPDLIPKGTRNIQALHIKTNGSAALPVLATLPDADLLKERDEGAVVKTRKRSREDEMIADYAKEEGLEHLLRGNKGKDNAKEGKDDAKKGKEDAKKGKAEAKDNAKGKGKGKAVAAKEEEEGAGSSEEDSADEEGDAALVQQAKRRRGAASSAGQVKKAPQSKGKGKGKATANGKGTSKGAAQSKAKAQGKGKAKAKGKAKGKAAE